MLPDTTQSWLAALIDGEGSIMLNRRTYSERAKCRPKNPHYRAVVSIAGTEPRLFYALNEKIGCGQIYQHRKEGDPRYPNHRSQWTWRLNSSQIRIVLPQVRDWLILKQQQADLLLEALEIKQLLTSRKGEQWLTADQRFPLVSRLGDLYAEIRRLNATGRAALESRESG